MVSEPALRLPGEGNSWERPKVDSLSVPNALGSQGPWAGAGEPRRGRGEEGRSLGKETPGVVGVGVQRASQAGSLRPNLHLYLGGCTWTCPSKSGM